MARDQDPTDVLGSRGIHLAKYYRDDRVDCRAEQSFDQGRIGCCVSRVMYDLELPVTLLNNHHHL
jgi:hypothetical protein